MSYDLIVYARRERIPDPDRFLAALAATTPVVAIGEEFADLRRPRTGFVPVRVEERDSGFELYAAPISRRDIDDFQADVQASGEEMTGGNARYLKILTSCDIMLTLVAKDELEAKAARAVASVLASLSEGYLNDPQTGLTTPPSNETSEAAP
jgi:hypothetical protein